MVVKEDYQICIKICPIWKDVYTVPERSSKNIKYRKGIPYVQSLNKKWRLVLTNTFNTDSEDFFGITIA